MPEGQTSGDGEIGWALAALLLELHAEHPGLLRPEVQDEHVMLWDSTGSGKGVWREWMRDEDDPYFQIADTVQEAAIEALWGERKPPIWPVCVAHPGTHPLSVDILDDQAVWVCPATRQAVRAVWPDRIAR